MHAVFKYDLPFLDDITIHMPSCARCLTVDVQRNVPRLWALVDAGAQDTLHHFRLAGTGHPIHCADGLEYIDTFFMEDGARGFHLFKVK